MKKFIAGLVIGVLLGAAFFLSNHMRYDVLVIHGLPVMVDRLEKKLLLLDGVAYPSAMAKPKSKYFELVEPEK